MYSEGPCGRYGAHPIEHQQMGGWEVLLDALPPLWIIQANMLSYEQISTKMEFTFLLVKNMYLFRHFSYGKQILCCFSNDGGLKGSPFENYLRLSTSHFVAIVFHAHTFVH